MARGFGTTYRRKGEGGDIWWIAYSVDGKRYAESSQSTKERDATDLLKQRHAEVLAGKFIGRAKKTSFEDLVSLLRVDYELKQRRSLEIALYRIEHLRKGLGRLPVASINHAAVSK